MRQQWHYSPWDKSHTKQNSKQHAAYRISLSEQMCLHNLFLLTNTRLSEMKWNILMYIEENNIDCCRETTFFIDAQKQRSCRINNAYLNIWIYFLDSVFFIFNLKRWVYDRKLLPWYPSFSVKEKKWSLLSTIFISTNLLQLCCFAKVT